MFQCTGQIALSAIVRGSMYDSLQRMDESGGKLRRLSAARSCCSRDGGKLKTAIRNSGGVRSCCSTDGGEVKTAIENSGGVNNGAGPLMEDSSPLQRLTVNPNKSHALPISILRGIMDQFPLSIISTNTLFLSGVCLRIPESFT